MKVLGIGIPWSMQDFIAIMVPYVEYPSSAPPLP